MWILTYPTGNRDFGIVVADDGSTPVFRDMCEALATGQRERIERPRPLAIGPSHYADLIDPVESIDGLTFDMARQESRVALTRRK